MSADKLNTLIVPENVARGYIDGLNITVADTNRGSFIEMTFFSVTAKSDEKSYIDATPTMSARAEFIARLEIDTVELIRDQLNEIIEENKKHEQ